MSGESVMNEKNRIPAPAEPLWATYIQQKGAALGLPLAGNFELTPRCNFSCKMCYVHEQVAKNEELSAVNRHATGGCCSCS